MNIDDGSAAPHDLDPGRRFGVRAEDYSRYRPDYPPAAIDAILRGLPEPRRLRAADIGAGTGISARALARRGVHVLAIEPDAHMRDAAEPHPSIEWRASTAEMTGLTSESVDLIVCAQVFHWVRQREALAEFHRVLRPRGRLALMWNNRDRTDALTRGYVEAIESVCSEHPSERKPFDVGIVVADGYFTPPKLERFRNGQDLDLTGLIGRATSASTVPKEGPEFDRLAGLLTVLFERHADQRGVVTMKYKTHVYIAERRLRS